MNNTSYRVFQLIHSSIWLSSSLLCSLSIGDNLFTIPIVVALPLIICSYVWPNHSLKQDNDSFTTPTWNEALGDCLRELQVDASDSHNPQSLVSHWNLAQSPIFYQHLAYILLIFLSLRLDSLKNLMERGHVSGVSSTGFFLSFGYNLNYMSMVFDKSVLWAPYSPARPKLGLHH